MRSHLTPKTLLLTTSSLLALIVASCSSLPERAKDVSSGTTEWELRDRFGDPEMMKQALPTDWVWVYTDGGTSCTFQLHEQRVVGESACDQHDAGSALDIAVNQIQTQTALAAQQAKDEKEEAAKKAAEEAKKRPFAPPSPVPGFH